VIKAIIKIKIKKVDLPICPKCKKKTMTIYKKNFPHGKKSKAITYRKCKLCGYKEKC